MRNPRLAITFKPEQYELIKRIAELTDQPMSKVLSEMFEVAYPSMKTLLHSLENIHKLNDNVKKELAESFDNAIQSSEEALSMIMEAISQADQERPPSSNTGVRPL